jgi:hypothetical protein
LSIKSKIDIFFTFGGTGGTIGGFGTFGSVMFQFKIGFSIGKHPIATEQSSLSVKVVSLIMLRTGFFKKYLFKF